MEKYGGNGGESPASKPFGEPASARSCFAFAGSDGGGSDGSASWNTPGTMLSVRREEAHPSARVTPFRWRARPPRPPRVVPRGLRIPLLGQVQPERAAQQRRDDPRAGRPLDLPRNRAGKEIRDVDLTAPYGGGPRALLRDRSHDETLHRRR